MKFIIMYLNLFKFFSFIYNLIKGRNHKLQQNHLKRQNIQNLKIGLFPLATFILKNYIILNFH
jgi:hypothetical protein